MSGSSRAGVLVYASDLARLSTFYCAVLGGDLRHAGADHHLVTAAGQEVLVHAIPAVIGAAIAVAVPPVLRESVAIKPFFTVTSLAAAREAAHQHGGGVFEEEWQGPGYLARNAFDCEGNVFQLREECV